MRKITALLFVMVLMVLIPLNVFAAEKKFVVGFVPRAFVSVYFVTMADAVKEEAAKNPNIDVQIVSPVGAKFESSKT